jgi:hypothetical protein
MLHLDADALLLQAHLGVDARAPLRLLQADLLLALSVDLVLLGALDLVLFLLAPSLDLLARASLGVLARLALGLEPRSGLCLFLAKSVVLDPAKLLEREEDRVLTLLGHVVPSPTGDENECR